MSAVKYYSILVSKAAFMMQNGEILKDLIIWIWEIPNLPRNKGDGF